MPIAVETLTIARIGGREFYLRFDAALEKDTIVVRDQLTLTRLGEALEAHTPEPAPEAEPTNGKRPQARAHGYSKVGSLGASREELRTALAEHGQLLPAQERTVLTLACEGRGIGEIAKMLKMSSSAIADVRRAAAQRLGFTPKAYPQLATRGRTAGGNHA